MALAALARLTGDAGAFSLAKAASGKPIVLQGGAPAPYYVSWSHSGAYLAVAATTAGPIGIDIEIGRPDRDIEGIAEWAFGPREVHRVRQEGPAGFYRIWTLREAMAKANGTGLIEVADRHDRVAEGPTDGFWCADGWHLLHQAMAPNQHLALAVRAPLATGAVWTRFTAGPDGDPVWSSSAPLPR
ncbi:4'-phosphopantetheinyl transferase superfamily protein [Dongia sp.]|uniref:4'-phosphopantetheinyl transferase family protein n=1 Tax=Dongia sp. TaxID=1977262 RepID=UPI0035B33723